MAKNTALKQKLNASQDRIDHLESELEEVRIKSADNLLSMLKRSQDVFKDDSLGRLKLIQALHGFGVENKVSRRGIESHIKAHEQEIVNL